MNLLKATWTIAWKDLRTLFRDRTGMMLGFLLPIILATAFGFIMKYAFGGGGGMPKVEVWVADLDDSVPSRRLVELLRNAEMLRVRPRADEPARDAAALRRLVGDGEAHHGLIVERGFGAAVAEGRLPELTMVRDPGRKMEDRVVRIGVMQAFLAIGDGRMWTASVDGMMGRLGMEKDQLARLRVAMQTMQTLISQFAAENEAKPADVPPDPARDDAKPAGDEQPVAEDGEQPVAADGAASTTAPPGFSLDFMDQLVPLANEDIAPPERPKNLDYQLAQSVSGIAVMMIMFGLVSCGAMLLYERENGTLRRLLAAAIPRSAILWSKYLFCAIFGLVQLTVMFLYGNLIFKINAFRDPLTLLVLSLTWIAAATSFGMLIAAWAKTTKQAEGLATILILVMAALGGCWFPIQMMDLPLAGEIATRSTLTYWAMSGFQGMFWDQRSWTDPKMLQAIGIQWAFTIAASALALALFKRRYVAG